MKTFVKRFFIDAFDRKDSDSIMIEDMNRYLKDADFEQFVIIGADEYEAMAENFDNMTIDSMTQYFDMKCRDTDNEFDLSIFTYELFEDALNDEFSPFNFVHKDRYDFFFSEVYDNLEYYAEHR